MAARLPPMPRAPPRSPRTPPALLRRRGAPRAGIALRDAPPKAGSTPAEWPARADLYVTFRKPIAGDDEANLKAIPRKQRAMVRKGIERGLTSAVDADADRLHRIYAESVRNLGTPVFSRRYFRAAGRSVRATHATSLTVLDGERADRLGDEFLLPRRGAALLRRRHGSGARIATATTSCTGR